jgi:hypothetical protein
MIRTVSIVESYCTAYDQGRSVRRTNVALDQDTFVRSQFVTCGNQDTFVRYCYLCNPTPESVAPLQNPTWKYNPYLEVGIGTIGKNMIW